MSKTRLVCHIVFATKNRKPTINPANKRELYSYIYGIIKSKMCTVIRINGMADHIHILADVHPTVSVSDLVKIIKQSSNHWMKGNDMFPKFESWAEGYFAAAVSNENVEACKNYIINQEQHHTGRDFFSEMEHLSQSNDIDWIPQAWT